MSMEESMDKGTRYYERAHLTDKVLKDDWKKLGAGRVLDLGCGAGELGEYKPEGSEVFGVDLDQTALQIASKYETVQMHNVEKPLPFEDGFFDAVRAKDIIEHLQKPWKTVEEIRRVLKTGGIVVATAPKPYAAFWNEYTHVRPYTRKGLHDLFSDYGFEITQVNRVGAIPLFGKLKLHHWIPTIMKIPGINRLFTIGWEVVARKK